MSQVNDSQKKQLISKVLSLTSLQIHELPPLQQAQAIFIQQSFSEIKTQSQNTIPKQNAKTPQKPLTAPPNKKQKTSHPKYPNTTHEETDDDSCIALSDIELDNGVQFSQLEYNWSRTVHYKNGMKGKSFGIKGKSFGIMGASFGALTTKTHRKSRTTINVFEKLNCIVHYRAVGSLSLTVFWKWGFQNYVQ